MNLNKNTEKTLKRDLDAENLRQVYLLWGEEDYLKEHYKQRVIQLTEKKFGVPAVTMLHEDNFSLDRFCDAIENLAFGMSASVIVLRDLERNTTALSASNYTALVEQLQDLPSCVIIVILFSERFTEGARERVLSRKEYIKRLSADSKGFDVEIKIQSRKDLNLWLNKHFCAQGLAIGKDVADFLLSVCDNRMAALSKEIEKIGALCHSLDDMVVTEEHVKSIAVFFDSAAIYDIVSSVIAKDYNGALRSLNRCKKGTENPIAVTAALGSSLLDVLAVKVAYDTGHRDIILVMNDLKIKKTRSYYVNRYMKDAHSIDRSLVEYTIRVLSDIDALQKSSAADPWELLEYGIASLSNWKSDMNAYEWT